MRYIVSNGNIVDDDLNKVLKEPSLLMSPVTLVEVGELNEVRKILHKNLIKFKQFQIDLIAVSLKELGFTPKEIIILLNHLNTFQLDFATINEIYYGKLDKVKIKIKEWEKSYLV